MAVKYINCICSICGELGPAQKIGNGKAICRMCIDKAVVRSFKKKPDEIRKAVVETFPR